uniref:Uncharacterized protein n=1 Tax=Salarias fasciatus TaxID=181472 RepID=A0A672IBJ7_SALFA
SSVCVSSVCFQCVVLQCVVAVAPAVPSSAFGRSRDRWTADEARILRVSVSSFLDHLSLVLQTMQSFGPPVEMQAHSAGTVKLARDH